MALHHAARHAPSEEVIVVLIDGGADASVRNLDGMLWDLVQDNDALAEPAVVQALAALAVERIAR